MATQNINDLLQMLMQMIGIGGNTSTNTTNSNTSTQENPFWYGFKPGYQTNPLTGQQQWLQGGQSFSPSGNILTAKGAATSNITPSTNNSIGGSYSGNEDTGINPSTGQPNVRNYYAGWGNNAVKLNGYQSYMDRIKDPLRGKN